MWLQESGQREVDEVSLGRQQELSPRWEAEGGESYLDRDRGGKVFAAGEQPADHSGHRSVQHGSVIGTDLEGPKWIQRPPSFHAGQVCCLDRSVCRVSKQRVGGNSRAILGVYHDGKRCFLRERDG